MSDTLTNWKNIAVFLDDSPEGARVGDYAAVLAKRFTAHLIGIHSIDGIPGECSADSYARGKQAIDGVIARQRAAEEDQALAVGRCFAALSAKHGVSSEFRVLWSGRSDDEALLNSLHCDLVVLGHPKPHGLPDNWSAERLLIASGVPLIIIPETWTADTVGGKALVAWNASREARRAISDAMPVLGTAQSVTVLVVDSARTPGKYGEDPGADIATYLARHGVRVDLEQVLSGGRSIAEVIAARVAEIGADLIVIGAYSHARSTEMIFGGVTRALLAHMPVPILVSR
ncbi:universal stress protein [Telmatospirillum sp.]|uniref:universal stress protein n=1 Tax=Telmatospirillum sp. TaxID=2079197 RepID=UPI0028505CD3|nr:universal stress protein [Telmatospirillum sp.]MDR3437721.1 universal stress protein [Telmatospirillum sp.]